MCDGLPGCSCPTCALQSMGYIQVMPAKVELKGLLPLLDKLRGNPDKMEALGLELQMVIDRYTQEVEEDLKSFAETSPHLSQPDEDIRDLNEFNKRLLFGREGPVRANCKKKSP